MNSRIQELLERIERLEQDLENEARQKRQEFQADFEARKVRFEQEVLAQQARFRKGLLAYMLGADWRHVLSMPFIYPLIVPLALLDLSVSLYQWICFPLYRMPRVRRRAYFVFDRTHLAYLNPLEKLNCAYCSYGNGLVAYVREVVGRTEQYWCPIKHARRTLQAHPYYHGFAHYGDAEHYQADLARLRQQLRAAADPHR
jgi:hypothetical protein